MRPVPPPALSVTGRRQKPVHHLAEGVVRFVCEKIADFLFSRWKSGQVERGAPQESDFAGPGRRFQSLLLELREHKPIHGRLRPSLILDRGHSWIFHRLEGPEALLGGRELPRRRTYGRRCGSCGGAWPDGAHLYPGAQVGDLFVLQLQTAGLGIARHDDRPALAAVQEALGRAQIESSRLYFGVMARLATVNQDRTDLLFKKLSGSGYLGPNRSSP